MIALARNFRLVPIVVFATASLFVLKTLGILLDGGFALSPDRSAPAAHPHVRATAPTLQSKIAAVKPASFWEREGLGDPEFTGEIAAQTAPGEANGATAKKTANAPSREPAPPASPASVDSHPPSRHLVSEASLKALTNVARNLRPGHAISTCGKACWQPLKNASRRGLVNSRMSRRGLMPGRASMTIWRPRNLKAWSPCTKTCDRRTPPRSSIASI